MNRREFNRLMGLGAATAATTSLFTGKASAASSLERIKSSGVLRVGAIADGLVRRYSPLTPNDDHHEVL